MFVGDVDAVPSSTPLCVCSWWLTMGGGGLTSHRPLCMDGASYRAYPSEDAQTGLVLRAARSSGAAGGGGATTAAAAASSAPGQ